MTRPKINAVARNVPTDGMAAIVYKQKNGSTIKIGHSPSEKVMRGAETKDKPRSTAYRIKQIIGKSEDECFEELRQVHNKAIKDIAKKYKTAGVPKRGAIKKSNRPIAKDPAGQSTEDRGSGLPSSFWRLYSGVDASKKDSGIGSIEAYFLESREGLGFCYRNSTHFEDANTEVQVKAIFDFWKKELEGLPARIWHEFIEFGHSGRDITNYVSGGIAFLGVLATEGASQHKVHPTHWRAVLRRELSWSESKYLPLKSKEDSVGLCNDIFFDEIRITNHNEAEALLIALAGAYKDYNEWKEKNT